jgi:peptidoglycan/LPS O-acetylase OafA/YrhL
MRFFINGHLSQRSSDLLGLAGVAIIFAAAYFFDDWSGFWFWSVALLGGLLGYVGAYGGLARNFGFEAPFTSDPLGWRKAKESYKSSEDADESVKKDSQP